MKASDLHRLIGRAVRAERMSQHISQEAFADSIGMHRTGFGAFERGEKDFQLSTRQLRRLTDELNAVLLDLCTAWETIHESD